MFASTNSVLGILGECFLAADEDSLWLAAETAAVSLQFPFIFDYVLRIFGTQELFPRPSGIPFNLSCGVRHILKASYLLQLRYPLLFIAL